MLPGVARGGKFDNMNEFDNIIYYQKHLKL